MVNYFTSFTFILDFKDGGLGVEGEGGEAGNLLPWKTPKCRRSLVLDLLTGTLYIWLMCLFKNKWYFQHWIFFS